MVNDSMICRLNGFSVHDVLMLTGMTARTGELVVESGNNIGSILFHEGRILQAFSPYSREIGDLLVEDGIITEHDLLETLQQQKRNKGLPLGGLLIRTGKVRFADIEVMVHQQIREAVREFIIWPSVSISFINKTVTPFDTIHLSVYDFIPPGIIPIAVDFFSKTHSHLKNAQTPPVAQKSYGV